MTRQRWVQLICFVVTVAIALWLLSRVGWGAIGDALGRIGWWGAVVVLLLGIAESAGDGLALALSIEGRRSLRVVAFNSVGGVLNQLLPFDLGEVAKVSLMHRYYPDGTAISGTIIWNYVFKLSRPLVALVAAVTGAVAYQSAPLGFRQLVLVGAAIGFLPYVFFRLLLRKGAAVLLVRFIEWVRRAPLLRRLPIPPSARLLEAAHQIDDAVNGFWRRCPRRYMEIFALQIAARLSSWASLVAALHFVGGEVTFSKAALLYAALNVAEFVITVLPARLGVAEGAAFGVFRVCGLDPALGVAMYLALRIKSLVTNGLLAPLAFLPVAPPPSAGAPPGEAQAANS